MKRLLFLALFVFLAPDALAQKVEPEIMTLDNGMKFLLLRRTEQPNSIAAGWVAKVGSANEDPGMTGISHFFEHMMFKGTPSIGTKDAALDRKLIDELAVTRQKLLDLHWSTQYERYQIGEIDDPWNPEHDTEEMKALRKKMEELKNKQKESIIKDEFDKVYTKLGASGMNAGTTHDVTIYFINVPSNKFELWAWMESDRLKNSVFREFFTERDVVHEERRLRTESTPTGIFQEQFDAMFWQSSPYSWPVIGWPSDLNSYTRQQAEDYYNIYYRPNNLVGMVVGDFEPAEVKATIKKYFSRLERGPEPPAVVTTEMEQLAEKRMYAECDCQPQIEVRYHGVPFMHADSYSLEILAEILNGRTGRLYKNLVEGKEIASSAGAGNDNRKYGGAFSFFAQTKGDATPEQLEEAWYEILKDIQENPVGERELQKVKNRVLANSFRRLQSNFFLMIQLGWFEALGGWEYINESTPKLQAVTPADIQAVAKKYFAKENRAVAIYKRKAGSKPEDPEIAALDPQAQQFVRQSLKRIAQEKDAAKLRQGLEQMKAQAAQVPEQFKSAMELLQKKMKERIAELDKEAGN